MLALPSSDWNHPTFWDHGWQFQGMASVAAVKMQPSVTHLENHDMYQITSTYGSGECMGDDQCLMYWVLWKTRNARAARKSRADSSPAAGLNLKPVLSIREIYNAVRVVVKIYLYLRNDAMYQALLLLYYSVFMFIVLPWKCLCFTRALLVNVGLFPFVFYSSAGL